MKQELDGSKNLKDWYFLLVLTAATLNNLPLFVENIAKMLPLKQDYQLLNRNA